MNVVPEKKPPYWLCVLCLIPLLGAFVGIALILMGIFKYKNKALIIIGSVGFLWTVLAFGYLFYNLVNSDGVSTALAETSKVHLNRLVKDIEFYKLQNGDYPDELEQLRSGHNIVMIEDPLRMWKALGRGDVNFHYKKMDDKYTVFSVGIDGLPTTADDIYPEVSMESGKLGLVVPEE